MLEGTYPHDVFEDVVLVMCFFGGMVYLECFNETINNMTK